MFSSVEVSCVHKAAKCPQQQLRAPRNSEARLPQPQKLSKLREERGAYEGTEWPQSSCYRKLSLCPISFYSCTSRTVLAIWIGIFTSHFILKWGIPYWNVSLKYVYLYTYIMKSSIHNKNKWLVSNSKQKPCSESDEEIQTRAVDIMQRGRLVCQASNLRSFFF